MSAGAMQMPHVTHVYDSSRQGCAYRLGQGVVEDRQDAGGHGLQIRDHHDAVGAADQELGELGLQLARGVGQVLTLRSPKPRQTASRLPQS